MNQQHHDIHDTSSREAVVTEVSLTARERMRIPLSLSVPGPSGETHVLVELAPIGNGTHLKKYTFGLTHININTYQRLIGLGGQKDQNMQYPPTT